MLKRSIHRAVPCCRSEELRNGISNYMALGFTRMTGSVQASKKQAAYRTWVPEHILTGSPALAYFFFFLGGIFSDHQQKQFLCNTIQWHLVNPTSKLKYLRQKKVQDKLLPSEVIALRLPRNRYKPLMLSNLALSFPPLALPSRHLPHFFT